MRRCSLFSTSLLLAVAPLLGAQSPRYAAGRDTLRYREITDGETNLTTPQGAITIKSDHKATVAVVRFVGDSARAWYDALEIGSTSPRGANRPATDAALHLPYRLRFDDRGHVTLLEAPAFPATFATVSDLTHEFDDFFAHLPAVPLKIGVTWTDTTVRADSTAEKSARMQIVATYRVERDTVVQGAPAFIFSQRQVLTSRTDSPVPNQPMRAVTVLSGGDEGLVVFAPRLGRMMRRTRTGQLTGTLTMSGGGREVEVKQEYHYTGSLELLKN